MLLLRMKARRSGWFAFLVITIILILLFKFRFLFRLLVEDGGEEASSVYALFRGQGANPKPELIPKIIHQTYKTTAIPKKWQRSQNHTISKHKDYEYMFWTDQSALDFISTNYPTYLETYTSYHYPIQRADALRYFVLYHYGGIYLDLDITPYRRLDILLTLPVFACLTTPTGISNDALGASPRHPFFLHIMKSLDQYNKNWLSPYITIMSSTGPLFLSLVWKEWIESGKNVGNDRVMVLEPFQRGYGIFYNLEGRSWQGWDEVILPWFERHWAFSIVGGLIAVVALVDGVWRSIEWGLGHTMREREKFL